MTEIAEWFDENGFFVGEFPEDCIRSCHHQGSCDDDVSYWRKVLGFKVPRQKAIDYLKEYGAWSVEEMEEWSDDDLAERVLWLAAGDIQENGEYIGLVH